MTPQTRYSDQHWKIEKSLADLKGEHLVLQHEIQQRYHRLTEIEIGMSRLQSQLETISLGEPS